MNKQKQTEKITKENEGILLKITSGCSPVDGKAETNTKTINLLQQETNKPD